MESRIKLLRTERRLKQSQLGDMIGVSQQTVSRIEEDDSKLSVDVLIRLCAYFGVTSDYILGLSDKKRGNDGIIKNPAEFEQYYNFYQVYKELCERDRKLLLRFGQLMRDVRKEEE